MQFGLQQTHQRRQRHVRPAQARGNPSVDQDQEPRVRRRLKVFAFVSAPIDTPLLPLAAWAAISSAVSIFWAAVPTPQRASPSCARRSRAAP